MCHCHPLTSSGLVFKLFSISTFYQHAFSSRRTFIVCKSLRNAILFERECKVQQRIYSYPHPAPCTLGIPAFFAFFRQLSLYDPLQCLTFFYSKSKKLRFVYLQYYFSILFCPHPQKKKKKKNSGKRGVYLPHCLKTTNYLWKLFFTVEQKPCWKLLVFHYTLSHL